ncbi:putative membrane protein [Xenococcus sp. PCC 7305]|uniref:DUF389 domain-containing protein n=1 Tax=Xenococcus sp. PCC 7305 TaxID=102125 RepID=UPI0002AC74F5|nr:DUF389 domain-containing protein [Xenococcus sp. PCC 7305]ELS04233.1 putative membrane protein [Xenococcus sp. PCC 7305]
MTWQRGIRQYLQQSWQSLNHDWELLREVPIPASELNQTLLQASLPAVNFYLLLALASMIATFGLLTNSAATIIGAMIIAPLMNPIISLAYALVVFSPKLLERAILTLCTGIILVIVISYLTTELLGLRVVGSEILSRTQPNSLDLGVAVAAGMAAAFANTRRSIANTLPGVAISVALVPPLAVVGIGLCLGELGTEIAASWGVDASIAAGSFILFLTNLVGIVFSGSLIFLFQRYGSLKKAAFGLIVALLGLLMLLQPLAYSLKSLYLNSNVMLTVFELRQNQPDLFPRTIRFRSINTSYREDNLIQIRAEVEAPSQEMNKIQERIDATSQALSKTVNQPVEINVNVVPYRHFKSQSQA